MEYIVISASIRPQDNDYTIRKVLRITVGGFRENQYYENAEYLNKETGKFERYIKLQDNRYRYQSKQEAVKTFRKYFPKDKFYVFDHVNDPK